MKNNDAESEPLLSLVVIRGMVTKDIVLSISFIIISTRVIRFHTTVKNAPMMLNQLSYSLRY